MLLLKNDHFILYEQRYCFIEDRPQANLAYIIALDEHNAMPIEIQLDVLYSNAQPVDYDSVQGQRAVRSRAATPAQTKCRDKAWALIEPLTYDPATLNKATRWQRISGRAKEVGVSPVSILKHLRRYWQRGQCLDALLADFDNCGKFDRDEHQISGRPSINPGRKNYCLTKKDEAHFRDVIERFYMKDERYTLTDTLQRLYEIHYSFNDGNGEVFINAPGERPTRRQLEYFLHKHYTVAQRLRARRGDKSFEMNHRAVLGTVAQQCRGVGHIYELDATIADVTLVSSIDRRSVIGRPTLYYVIDRFSRLIVGWYVGLEAPSWSAALQAIFSIAQDKRTLCERLNIEYDPAHWPAQGIMPEHLYADRGEVMSREAQKLCTALATVVTNLPSCRPDWKPMVEGRFKLSHQAIADAVPGYNPHKIATRRRGDAFSLEACLTPEEFEAIIVKSIITHNRSIQQSYPLTNRQILDGIEPSPINIWSHGIISSSGQLTRHSEASLRFALLPELKATVSGQGIFVNGCYYMPAEHDVQDWFVTGRQRRFNVQVTHDRRRVDTIFVHDPNTPAGYFMAKLTPRSEQFQGMSLDEVKALQAAEAEIKSNSLSHNVQLRAELHRFTDPLVSHAKQQAKTDRKGVSKAGRKRDIVETRGIERDIERDNIAVLGEISSGLPQKSPSPLALQRPATPSVNAVDSMALPVSRDIETDRPASGASNVVALSSNAPTPSVPASPRKPTESKSPLDEILRQAKARLDGKSIGAFE